MAIWVMEDNLWLGLPYDRLWVDHPRISKLGRGKYHVQVEDFERFTVPILDRVLSESANQETVPWWKKQNLFSIFQQK